MGKEDFRTRGLMMVATKGHFIHKGPGGYGYRSIANQVSDVINLATSSKNNVWLDHPNSVY